MLDNLHLAQQALRQVREDMPRSYYGQLPKLVDGPLRGYPRIYDIAQRLVTRNGWRNTTLAQIVARELLTPVDLEREFGMEGGHWHHGEIAVDQLLMLRPVPLAAQYAMPIDGLYLCGAGAHPGGGVMGLAGRNAAREIIRLGNAA